jgi:hypothetical protein
VICRSSRVLIVVAISCLLVGTDADAGRLRWRLRRCKQQADCCRPCEPCALPCMCIIRQYFTMPYIAQYHAHQHPDCDDCPNFSQVVHFGPSGLPSQDCLQNQCSPGLYCDSETDQPLVDVPSYPYDVLRDVDDRIDATDSFFNACPNDRVLSTATGQVTTPDGNVILVQLFKIKLVPDGHVIFFGSEIKHQGGERPPIQFTAAARRRGSHLYAFDVPYGGDLYVTVSSQK